MKNRPISARTVIAFSLLLFVAAWLLYANSLANRFAFDDKSLVTENRFVTSGASLRDIFTTNYRAGSGFTGDGLYRPLVMLTYIWNGGPELDPVPFHFFNITLNALNSVLVFLFVLILSGSIPISAITGLIFTFHPIHTEAVANIAGRPELMYVFFLLLAWIILERYRERLWTPFLSALLLFAAILSKETAVMFPFMAAALDLARKRPFLNRNTLLTWFLLLATVGGYLFVRWSILGETAAGLDPDFVDNPIAHAAFMERTATALGVLTRYIMLLMFPLRLSSDYSFNQIPVISSWLHPLPIIGLLLGLGLIAAAIRFLVRNRTILPAAGLILFSFPYFLVSNLVLPVGTIMGERLMYLPTAGFALAGGLVLAPLFSSRRSLLFGLMAILMGLYSVRTVSRTRDWRDDRTLFSADLRNSPNSAKVRCNLGYLTGKEGNLEESLELFRQALDIHPDNTEALRGYGRRLYDLRRYEESVKYYARAVRIDPGNPETRKDYAIVLQKVNRYDAAEQELRAAIRLNPSTPVPYQELSSVLIAREDFAGALSCLERAAELGGDERIILNNSAVAQFLSGNIDAAFQIVQRAESRGIRIREDLAGAIRNAVMNSAAQ